jgi:hypothetical protein
MSPEGGAESVALTEIRQARRYRQRGADDTSEFSKDRREPVPWIGIEAQFVVTAPQVLNERRPSADHSGRAEPFEPTHRFQPGFEPTMIGFDGVVRVLLHDMARRGQQLIEHPRIHGSSVGAHPCWAWAMLEGAGEEPASGRQIPILRDDDVDDLAVLVDRPVQLDQRPATLTYVSSTNHRSPGACRQGRAASTSSGVNRCTQR